MCMQTVYAVHQFCPSIRLLRCQQVSCAADRPVRRLPHAHHVVAYTKGTLSVINWPPMTVASLSHTECPPKLTTLVTVEVLLRWQNSGTIELVFGTDASLGHSYVVLYAALFAPPHKRNDDIQLYAVCLRQLIFL